MPIIRPVKANEYSKTASNHSGISLRGLRWMRSVIMYGELGKKMSHAKAYSVSFKVPDCFDAFIAKNTGTHASSKFQGKNM